MRRYWWAVLLVVSFSCANDARSNPDIKKKVEAAQIYGTVIKRAEQLNGKKIAVDRDLVVAPLTPSNLGRVKRGMRTYNAGIQSAIDDYNTNESTYSLDALKRMKKLGRKDSVYRLSKIGFSDSLDYAVLYESDYVSPEFNHRSYLIFRKQDGLWELDSEIME